MRQHAILSCLFLCLSWAALFGPALYQSVGALPEWHSRILFWSVLPLAILLGFYRRSLWKPLLFRSNLWGFIGIWGVLGLRFYAAFFQAFELERFCVCLLLPLIFLASLGLRATWALLFPICSVFLLYPFANPLMQAIEQGLWQGAERWLPEALDAFRVNQPLLAREHLMPCLPWVTDLLVLSLFVAYVVYESLWRRLLFLGLLLGLCAALLFLQFLSLAGIWQLGGLEVLAVLDKQQFNQVGLVLSLGLVVYLSHTLMPKPVQFKRMMADYPGFMVLIDRHSHWFALTLTAWLMMVSSVWLSRHCYDLVLSVLEGRFFLP